MDSSIVNSSLDTLVNTPSLKLISKIVKIGSKKSAFSKHSIFRNNKKLLFNYDTSNDINNDDTNDSTNGTNYDTTNDKQIINNTTNYNNTNLDINSKKSFGVTIMQERVASIGGTIDIYKETGGGTVININIPIMNV